MSDYEKRHIATTELRVDMVAGEDGVQKPKFVGYALRFNSMSEDLGGFKEVIKIGAPNRNLDPNWDMRALGNHDPSIVLGRTKNNTLKLNANSQGLSFEIDPPDTQNARDFMTLVRDGFIDGCSFAFRALKDNWKKVDGQVVRELLDIEIKELSLVTFPAYRATSVSVRSIELAKECGKPEGIPLDLLRLQLQLAELD